MKQVWALIPLKDLASAKTRLSSALDAEARRSLALAMAIDVATAMMHSHAVDRVIMVSDIPNLEQLIEIEGIGYFDTGQAQGLNEDLETAAAWAAAQGATHVLIAHADLPWLTPRAIERFVFEACDLPASRLRAAACKEGCGTNLLLAPLPLPLPLVFGKNSLARFCQSAAAVKVAIDVIRNASLAADIDEPGDLRILAAACTRGKRAGRATTDFLLPTMPASTEIGEYPEPEVWPPGIFYYAARKELALIKKRAHG
jgi:2-phospho-L-lactate guanylyltransferase